MLVPEKNKTGSNHSSSKEWVLNAVVSVNEQKHTHNYLEGN